MDPSTELQQELSAGHSSTCVAGILALRSRMIFRSSPQGRKSHEFFVYRRSMMMVDCCERCKVVVSVVASPRIVGGFRRSATYYGQSVASRHLIDFIGIVTGLDVISQS